jgi:hypothetical protein
MSLMKMSDSQPFSFPLKTVLEGREEELRLLMIFQSQSSIYPSMSPLSSEPTSLGLYLQITEESSTEFRWEQGWESISSIPLHLQRQSPSFN